MAEIEPGSARDQCARCGGWISLGHAIGSGCHPAECHGKGGPTEKYPDRPYCKDDQSCCDFVCGN